MMERKRNADSRGRLPKLRFVDETFEPLLENLNGDAAIFVDSYNARKVQHLPNMHLIRDNSKRQLDALKAIPASQIIAIGGCTVLDIARAAATPEQELVLIPSILSTACISVNKAIVRVEGRSQVLQARAPDHTIISLPFLMETEYPELVKWSQSGFADVFARLGASMDFAYQNLNLNSGAALRLVPDCKEAIEWVLTDFKNYNEDALKRLAYWSHIASLHTIEGDLAVGGEHRLYHILMEQRAEYTNEKPTHGQIVGAGILIEAKLFSEISGDNRIFEMLQEAYRKLDLPLTFEGLSRIGILREHLLAGLEAVGKRDDESLLHDQWKQACESLDNAFSDSGESFKFKVENIEQKSSKEGSDA